MSSLPNNVDNSIADNVRITNVFFANNLLTVALNDGRIIIYPCHQMEWLTTAAPDKQQAFEIESDGYGVWWTELDDGIALHHILSPVFTAPLAVMPATAV